MRIASLVRRFVAVLRTTGENLLAPVLFLFRRQLEGDRIDLQDLQVNAAAGALDDLVLHDVVQLDVVEALRALGLRADGLQFHVVLSSGFAWCSLQEKGRLIPSGMAGRQESFVLDLPGHPDEWSGRFARSAFSWRRSAIEVDVVIEWKRAGAF